MAINKINTRSIQDTTVTSDDIQDNAITNDKVSPSAAIAQSKVSGLTTSISNLCSSISSVSGKIDTATNNIGLLGFKMAVNDGLTVFNLVDGVVDEFHDESGTDEGEGSNDLYNCSSDYYINSTTPDGANIGPYSAGFSNTAVTEEDTSEAGNNPTYGSGAMGTFTVPTGVTSVSMKVWGAGGDHGAPGPAAKGGGGGFSSGNLAVTGGQTMRIIAGEGGAQTTNSSAFRFGGRALGCNPNHPSNVGTGGGISGVFGVDLVPLSGPQVSAPQVYMVAGSGGGGGGQTEGGNFGGAGGGTGGDAGGQTTEQTSKQSGPTHPDFPSPYDTGGGGGGDQEQGGDAGPDAGLYTAQAGSFLTGGNGVAQFCARLGAGGGAGYYGGGGGAGAKEPPGSPVNYQAGGGGGSGYVGHPQITSGASEEGASDEGGGTADPTYVACTNEGGTASPDKASEDGYVLITACTAASATSTTITSEAFAAGSVPTVSRIVVFEENVATPTLNTDIIASISRNGGSNFTTATLADSGYVTGSSGQRILTGQATISGQPSGQSMRWKLALANNTVKIHGVALQWS